MGDVPQGSFLSKVRPYIPAGIADNNREILMEEGVPNTGLYTNIGKEAAEKQVFYVASPQDNIEIRIRVSSQSS